MYNSHGLINYRIVRFSTVYKKHIVWSTMVIQSGEKEAVKNDTEK